MTNRKSTKRALVSSALVILVCVAMLIGTTFAWFTDTASTGVNTIQAGNLKMEVTYKNASERDFTALNENTNVFMQNARWEPGHVEYAVLNVKNTGTLALKYKLGINIASETGSTNVLGNQFNLSDYIKFAVIDDDKSGTDRATLVAEAEAEGRLIKEVYSKENNLTTTGANKTVTLVVWMPTDVGNNANYKVGATAPEIKLGINVVATQYTHESDSFGNTYDQNAPSVYPAGVTAASFESATSVYYYDTYGGAPYVRLATTADEIQNHPAAVAYVDANGNVCYAADVYCAVANDATTIYCKENATLKVRSVGTNRTEDLTKDLTIHANGADFQYGEIALNSTTAAAQDITVKVYDAKNLYIWGLSPAEGKALTVLMENCHNIGTSETNTAGRMFYISNRNGTQNGTIYATLRSCSVEKSDSPVYMNADGSLTLESCTFTQCAVPVNNNYKSAGTRTDVVKDCKFIRCGCTAEMNSNISSYAAPIRFVKSGSGTLTVTLENNTFNGTIGTNGDILLGDYRPSKVSNTFEATIVTANPVMVKSSTETAYSYNGGTVNVLDK